MSHGDNAMQGGMIKGTYTNKFDVVVDMPKNYYRDLHGLCSISALR